MDKLKHILCHSRENRNLEKILLSHPEFISGSISTIRDAETVQHDVSKTGFPPSRE
ncbi:hypothetical protein [Rickettsia endosymbiont of Halotydeus destructor]|uniref:hypothetical protein n=1 Tax=Rickettsia endosymbiont of Halotydeus destructor TaxID=2996754 RepID=UPI003BAFD6EF